MSDDILSRETLTSAIEYQIERILVAGGINPAAIGLQVIGFQTPSVKGEGVVVSARALGFCERVTWLIEDRRTDRVYRVCRSARQVARRLGVKVRARRCA